VTALRDRRALSVECDISDCVLVTLSRVFVVVQAVVFVRVVTPDSGECT